VMGTGSCESRPVGQEYTVDTAGLQSWFHID
jgi:hypothetical protein